MASDGAGGLFVVWQDSRNGALDLYAQRMTSAGAIATGWPVNGLPICTAASDQKNAAMALDGTGGFFVAWEDYRLPGGESNVYVQHVTSSGTIASGWPVDGLGVCTVSAPQGYPCITVSNGSAIVAWEDSRSGLSSDIYAQRISALGVVQWAANGSSARPRHALLRGRALLEPPVVDRMKAAQVLLPGPPIFEWRFPWLRHDTTLSCDDLPSSS